MGKNDQPIASIITVGSEILKGKIVDINSSNISEYLNNLGLNVKNHISVSDDLSDIINVFEKTKDCNIVITTGGLGPTADDNTKKAFSEFVDKKLYFDKKIWKILKINYFTNRKNIPNSNKNKQ